MNKVNEIFSKNLNQCLKDKRMTATKVAKKLNVSKTTVCQWRKAQRFPRSNQLEQLAKILEKPIHWFFEEEHKETQEVRALTPIEVVAEALKELNETIDNQNEIISAEIGALADKLNDINIALQQIVIALNEMNK